VVGIAGDLGGPSVLDGRVYRTGVGTVVRAGATDDASGHVHHHGVTSPR
jgi:hypothetical protein